MRNARHIAGLVLPLLLGSAASAGSVLIDIKGSNDAPFSMHSSSLAGIFGQSAAITRQELINTHAELKASGIRTNGKVTFVLVDTASHGLAFLALVDKRSAVVKPPRGVFDSSLSISSTVSGDAQMLCNDAETDLTTVTHDPANGTQTAAGEFKWNSKGRADAFAWGGLDDCDTGSFLFGEKSGPLATGNGLKSVDAFQFVTFDGESWVIAKTGDFSSGSFGFSFAVVPIPAAAAVGALGLAGVVAFRRRAVA